MREEATVTPEQRIGLLTNWTAGLEPSARK